MSEIAPKEQLHERTAWAANAIAPNRPSPSRAPSAPSGAHASSVTARHCGSGTRMGLGTNQDSIAAGQKLFESGTRIDWRSR